MWFFKKKKVVKDKIELISAKDANIISMSTKYQYNELATYIKQVAKQNINRISWYTGNINPKAVDILLAFLEDAKYNVVKNFDQNNNLESIDISW